MMKTQTDVENSKKSCQTTTQIFEFSQNKNKSVMGNAAKGKDRQVGSYSIKEKIADGGKSLHAVVQRLHSFSCLPMPYEEIHDLTIFGSSS